MHGEYRKYFTIVERGWAKYRDLSVASRSIICRSRGLRQIIDLRDTDKSRYFAITEFNNCFILRLPFFCSTKYGKSLSACWGNWSAIFTHERSFNYAWAEYYLQQNTYVGIAGHVVSSRPMKRKEKIHRMIISLVCSSLVCLQLKLDYS